MKGRVRAQSFLNLILNSTTEKAEEGDPVDSPPVTVWVFGLLALAALSLLIASMFSFYCCRKWLPASVLCCCCPSRDDETSDGTPSLTRGEKEKLIEEGGATGHHAPRPPNPLIPSHHQKEKKTSNGTGSEDESDDERDKVKRRTLPTRPAIKVTTSTQRSTSVSPAPSPRGGSRASSPRAPAFDIVTDPSNPLLRMK